MSPEAVDAVILISAMTPAAACVWAGLGHVREPDGLADALRQAPALRRLLSPRIARRAARAWGAAELATGGGVCAALLAPAPSAVQVLAVVWLSLLYLMFSAWLAVLWRSVPAANCGCGRGADPADGLALLRTGLLGACAVAPALLMSAGYRPALPAHAWVTLPMAAVLALLIWLLPVSVRLMEEPS